MISPGEYDVSMMSPGDYDVSMMSHTRLGRSTTVPIFGAPDRNA